MPKCSVKCGLFVPRSCPQLANNLCNICGKPACTEHSEIVDQQIICLNCRSQATTQSMKAQAAPSGEFDLNYWRTQIQQNRTSGGTNAYTSTPALDITFNSEDFLSFDDAGNSGTGIADSDVYQTVES